MSNEKGGVQDKNTVPPSLRICGSPTAARRPVEMCNYEVLMSLITTSDLTTYTMNLTTGLQMIVREELRS